MVSQLLGFLCHRVQPASKYQRGKDGFICSCHKHILRAEKWIDPPAGNKQNYEWFELMRCAKSLMLNTEKAIAVSVHTRQERDPAKPEVRFDNTNIA